MPFDKPPVEWIVSDPKHELFPPKLCISGSRCRASWAACICLHCPTVFQAPETSGGEGTCTKINYYIFLCDRAGLLRPQAKTVQVPVISISSVCHRSRLQRRLGRYRYRYQNLLLFLCDRARLLRPQAETVQVPVIYISSVCHRSGLQRHLAEKVRVA
jgi:hypothetical protein